jgi:sigma-E factor negative regulatory protein RseA
MQDETEQQLSAYADGELGRDERRFLERRLAADPALRQALERHYTMRAAIRGEHVPGVEGLADRVRGQIQAEPAHNGVDDPAQVGWRRASFMMQPVAGLAIAASVALGLVVAWPMLTAPSTPAPTATPVQIAAEPTSGSLSRVGGPSAGPRDGAVDAQLRRELQPYFIDHNDQTAARAIGGTLESARIIGHDRER